MTIDVSDVLLDVDLADSFTVNRRKQTLDHGRPIIAIETTFNNVYGIVTAAHPNDLDRLDDSQRMGRNLSVVTQFRLQGPAMGYQPDTVIWKGDTYVVKSVDPYPQFGKGFVQAIVGSMDTLDQPTP